MWRGNTHEIDLGHWWIGQYGQCIQGLIGMHDGRIGFHQNLHRERICQCNSSSWTCHVQVCSSSSHLHRFFSHCSKFSFFVRKFNFDFPRKLLIFLGWKTGENVVVWDFYSCWQLWFHEKKFGVKNWWNCWGFCLNWIFGQKFDFSNSVFLMGFSLFYFPLQFSEQYANITKRRDL